MGQTFRLTEMTLGICSSRVIVVLSVGKSPISITNSMLMLWIVAGVIILVVQLATRDLKLIPTGLQNFVEWIIESLYKFFEGILDEHLVKPDGSDGVVCGVDATRVRGEADLVMRPGPNDQGVQPLVLLPSQVGVVEAPDVAPAEDLAAQIAKQHICGPRSRGTRSTGVPLWPMSAGSRQV